MRNCPIILLFYLIFSCAFPGSVLAASISDETQECLDCHGISHPGIVEDWRQSRHAQIQVGDALVVKGLKKKISAETVPEAMSPYAVGCAECHTMNASSHTDTFEHNGYDVHTVVSPPDCAVCHTEEVNEYSENLMSHARNNLAGNTLYRQLQISVIGKPVYKTGEGLSLEAADTHTRAEACYYCHGTQLEVTGYETRDTIVGELTFPVIHGWPNQGVGRHNPDGSKGACSACHPRHGFSIEVARKPDTCKECHSGPDVPGYKVYSTSKHGNIYASTGGDWNFKSVPWTVGEDFTAPTCAACHISLVTNSEGDVVAERSHRMNDRLPWRLFGVVYAHPHPVSPDLTVIRNREGQPLPASLDGTFAAEFLIDAATQARRKENMTDICLNCHATSWVNGHWERFEASIRTTNAATRTATDLMNDIWDAGLAGGPEQNLNPFDETPEREWTGIWLFYANTIRFSSAMGGGGDYSVFADGAYQLSEKLHRLEDWYLLRKQGVEDSPTTASGSSTRGQGFE